MDQLVEILKKSSLFSHLSDEVIEQDILPRGRMREFPKGSYLVQIQERYCGFGIVVKGKVNLMHINFDGNYGIIGALEQNDLFGVDLICTRSSISPYYAIAVQPTQMLYFPASMVLDPGTLPEDLRLSVLRHMLTYIADENMRKEYRLAILFQKGIRDRIMTYLTMQANKRHSATFTIPFTRDELASYLCVNRTCLSHELTLMKQEGLIECRLSTFTLLNYNPNHGEF